MADKQLFDSIFDAQLKVDVPNYITELLMDNYFKVCKKDVPRTAFWRKEYKESSSNFEHWSGKYSLELSEIKNLLKVFPARPVAQTIKAERTWTIKYLKLEDKQKFLYKLYNATLKFHKDCVVAASKETVPDEVKTGATATFANGSKRIASDI